MPSSRSSTSGKRSRTPVPILIESFPSPPSHTPSPRPISGESGSFYYTPLPSPLAQSGSFDYTPLPSPLAQSGSFDYTPLPSPLAQSITIIQGKFERHGGKEKQKTLTPMSFEIIPASPTTAIMPTSPTNAPAHRSSTYSSRPSSPSPGPPPSHSLPPLPGPSSLSVRRLNRGSIGSMESRGSSINTGTRLFIEQVAYTTKRESTYSFHAPDEAEEEEELERVLELGTARDRASSIASSSSTTPTPSSMSLTPTPTPMTSTYVYPYPQDQLHPLAAALLRPISPSECSSDSGTEAEHETNLRNFHLEGDENAKREEEEITKEEQQRSALERARAAARASSRAKADAYEEARVLRERLTNGSFVSLSETLAMPTEEEKIVEKLPAIEPLTPTQATMPTAVPEPEPDIAALHLRIRTERSRSETHKRVLLAGRQPPTPPITPTHDSAKISVVTLPETPIIPVRNTAKPASISSPRIPSTLLANTTKTPRIPTQNPAKIVNIPTPKTPPRTKQRPLSPDIATILSTIPRPKKMGRKSMGDLARPSIPKPAPRSRAISVVSKSTSISSKATSASTSLTSNASSTSTKSNSKFVPLAEQRYGYARKLVDVDSDEEDYGVEITRGGASSSTSAARKVSLTRREEEKKKEENVEEGEEEGQDVDMGYASSDSSLDLHTPLPNLMVKHGHLSVHSKVLPSAEEHSGRPESGMSMLSTTTKSGLMKDERNTPMRRVRHRDGRQLRGGMGLTTGLGWSDSEDENAPSALTRSITRSISSLKLRNSYAESTTPSLRRSSSSSVLQVQPITRTSTHATIPENSVLPPKSLLAKPSLSKLAKSSTSLRLKSQTRSATFPTSSSSSGSTSGPETPIDPDVYSSYSNGVLTISKLDRNKVLPPLPVPDVPRLMLMRGRGRGIPTPRPRARTLYTTQPVHPKSGLRPLQLPTAYSSSPGLGARSPSSTMPRLRSASPIGLLSVQSEMGGRAVTGLRLGGNHSMMAVGGGLRMSSPSARS